MVSLFLRVLSQVLTPHAIRSPGVHPRNLTVCEQSVSTCMKLCVMNCCSDHVRDNKCDLVALTETWLSPDNA